MTRYEIYIWDNGRLHPTGIATNNLSLDLAERELNKTAKQIRKPCTIMIIPFDGK